MPFSDVRLIQDGTKVDSDVTNKPVLDLIDRTNYLKEQLDNISIQTSSLFLLDRDCSDDCKNSNFVYFDITDKKWKPGYASISKIDNKLYTDQNSYIQGIIQNITGTPGQKKGKITIYGLVTDIDIINLMVENSQQIGSNIYLATDNIHKGQGTYTEPELKVFCGKFITDNTILFQPYFFNLGESHRHIWFDLDLSKFHDTGLNETLTGTATFTNGSANVTGIGTLFATELQANDWIILDSDNKPYKILSITDDTHLTLISNYNETGGTGSISKYIGNWLYPWSEFEQWPPITYASAILVLDENTIVPNGKFNLTADGAHYINPNFDPTTDTRRFTLYYEIPYGIEESKEITKGITSLLARTLNLKIYKQGTQSPASVGDLEILSIPIFNDASETSDGDKVVKSLNTNTITGDINVFRGRVVESLYPKNSRISILTHGGVTGESQGKLDIGYLPTWKGRFVYSGEIVPNSYIDIALDDKVYNGFFNNIFFFKSATIVQSYIRISSYVTNGTLDLEVYITPTTGADRRVNELELSMNHNAGYNIYRLSTEYPITQSSLIVAPGEKLHIKLKSDTNFVGYVNPANPDEIYSIEIIFDIVDHLS